MKSFYKWLTIISISLLLLVSHVYATEKSYTSSSSISLKTRLLMWKYPEIHKRVDIILEKVYTKIQTKSLRIQKIIYIRLQERIEKFKIKYEERSDIIILLNYINESVGVELYRTDKKIEEQKKEELKKQEKNQIIPIPIVPTEPEKAVETQQPRQITDTTQRPETSNSNENSGNSEEIHQTPVTAIEPTAPSTETSNSEWEEWADTEESFSVLPWDSEVIDEEGSLESPSTITPPDDTPPSPADITLEELEPVQDSGTNLAGDDPLEWGENSAESIIPITPPPLPWQEPEPEEEELLNEITVIEEQEQTLLVNEIGRFISTVSVNIESMTLIVIGDRNFTFPNNTLYIRNAQGETLATNIAYRLIAENSYEFDFIDVSFPEGTILLQTDVFSIESDANTEVTIKEISIPEDIDIETNFAGKKLLSKDRLKLNEIGN